VAASTPITPEERDRILALHREGKSRNDIARETGRSAGSVTAVVKQAGLAFDRAPTKAATEAKAVDCRARRAQLELDLLEDAQRLRKQLWEPHVYIDHGGKDYCRVTWTQDEPTPTDKLKLMQAASAAIDRSLRISDHDTDNGTEDAKAMLTSLGRALGIGAGGE